MTDTDVVHGGPRHGGPPIHDLVLAPGVVIVEVAGSTVAYVAATMELLELSAAAATLVAALRDGRRHRVRRPGTLARQLLDLGVLELAPGEPAPTSDDRPNAARHSASWSASTRQPSGSTAT